MKKILFGIQVNMPDDSYVIVRRYVSKRDLEKYLGQIQEEVERVKKMIKDEF